MTISFIIRLYNEEKYIGECLNAIARQTGTFQKQIICVDDNSNDKSIEIIKKFAKENLEIEVKVISLKERFSFSSAINIALPEVTGDYTVILSAHATLATEEWLLNIVENFKDPFVAICYGRLLVRAR